MTESGSQRVRIYFMLPPSYFRLTHLPQCGPSCTPESLASENSNKNTETCRLVTPTYSTLLPYLLCTRRTGERTRDSIHSTKGLFDLGTPYGLCRKTILSDAINKECRHEQKNRRCWGVGVGFRYEEQRVWVQSG